MVYAEAVLCMSTLAEGYLQLFIRGYVAFSVHLSEHCLEKLPVPLYLAILPVSSRTRCVSFDIEPLQKGCKLFTVQPCPRVHHDFIWGSCPANPMTSEKLNYMFGFP